MHIVIMKILIFLVCSFAICNAVVPKLEIVCEKNCPPASKETYTRHKTEVSVKCLENCEGINPNKYKWKLEVIIGYITEVSDDQYDKYAETGRFGPKFVLNELIDKPEEMIISVTIDDPAFPEVDVEEKYIEYIEEPYKAPKAPPKLEIVCEKNCPPASKETYTGQETKVSVKCLKNCEGINPKKYKWTLETPSNQDLQIKEPDYNQLTKTGRFGPKLVITKNIKDKGTMIISVTIDDPAFPKVVVGPKKINYKDDPSKAPKAPPKLEIVCQRNCPPASKETYTGQETEVSVKCLENCEGIDEKKYKWTLETPSNQDLQIKEPDYNQLTKTGRFGPKLVITKNIKDKGTMIISVTINDPAFPKVVVGPKKINYKDDPSKAPKAPPKLEIVCEKNCPPASKETYTGQETEVSVKCLENCEGIDEKKYKWTLETPSNQDLQIKEPDYNQLTKTGRFGPKLVITNDIKDKGTMIISVTIDDPAFPKVVVGPKKINYKDDPSKAPKAPPKLEIVCEKNCPPASKETYTGQETEVSVKCLENCEGIDEKKYKWTLETPSNQDLQIKEPDYNQLTKTGRFGPKLVITNDIKDKGTMIISVTIDDPAFPKVVVGPKKINYKDDPSKAPKAPPKLEIVCEKNCPPASKETYTGQETEVSVKCLENCEGIDEKKYKWTLETPSNQDLQIKEPDYNQLTKTGRFGPKLVITNDIKDKGTMIISVTIYDPAFPKVVVEPKKINYKDDPSKAPKAPPKLEIVCQRNCPPASKETYTGQETEVSVKCLENCEGIDEKKYKWTLETPSNQDLQIKEPDYNQLTKTGRFGPKLVVTKNIKDKGTMIISVTIDDPAFPKVVVEQKKINYKDDPSKAPKAPPKLEIVCEKNCPPASKETYTGQETEVSVKCLENCEGIDEKKYKWTLETPSNQDLQIKEPDYDQLTESGRFGPKLVITKNIKDKGTMIISVTIDDPAFPKVVVEPKKINYKDDPSKAPKAPPTLEIVCEENCPPASKETELGKKITVLVNCLENCDKIDEKNYKWTFDCPSDPNFTQSFDYTRYSSTGRSGKKFVLNENIDVDPKKTYRIDVTIDQPDFSKVDVKAKELTFVKHDQGGGGNKNATSNATWDALLECTIQPEKSGISLKTDFSLKCNEEKMQQQPPQEYAFYCNEMLIIAGLSPDFFKKSFTLSSDCNDFHITYINGTGTESNVNVSKVNVTNPDDQASPEKVRKQLAHVYDEIKDKLTDKDPSQRQKGLSGLVSLAQEVAKSNLTDDESEKWLTKIKTDTTKKLLDTPIEHPYADIIQISQALNTLMEKHELPETDPSLLKATSTLCVKMSLKYLEAVQSKEVFVVTQKRNDGVAKVLTQCTENNQKPNFDIMTPVKLEVSTKEPTVFGEVITENYPDYEDFDEKYFKHLHEMGIATNNIINSTLTAAKIMALSMEIGDVPKNITAKSVETIVCKNLGQQLLNTTIQSHGVRVIPSQDWAGTNHSFDILLCTWNRDLMWWNRNHTHVATDVLNIEFWHSTCKDKVESFSKPVQFTFNITGTSSFQLIKVNDSIVVPKGFPSVKPEIRDPIIKVRRFVVPPGTALRVNFHNLSQDLKYVALHDEFPVYEHFSNATILTPEQATIHLSNNNSYAHCFHVGLLPMGNTSQLHVIYEISSVIVFCIKWNTKSHTWERACQAVFSTATNGSITCECRSFSVIAGYLQNTESQALELMKLDIELELKSSYVILVTVAVIIGLYCLLLILAAPKPKLNVYFLGDNDKHELYAYLLVIKTANVRNAGTTSNVMIRIHGKMGASDAHVINYPDPKVRLLQRWSENWFVLTTQQFLGEITKIELWFDCTGYSPSWYCKQITIYDMLTQNSVTFDVSTRFSLVQNIHYVQVDLEHKNKVNFRSRLFNDYHTWICGSDNYNFTFVKRIHVILAMILLIFVFNLILLGLPAMELNDTLDNFDIFNGLAIGLPFLTGTIAFLIALPIAWMFRWSAVKYHTLLSTLAWTLIIFIISGCLSILIVFGFWVPFTVGFVWLIISITAILFVVIVLENGVGLLITSCVKPRPYDEVGEKLHLILAEVEKQRPILYKRFGGSFLRPYFQHLTEPMDMKAIHVKSHLERSRIKVVGDIEDLMMFGVYIIMLYLVVLAGKDTSLVTSNNHFVEMAMGWHTRTLDFTNIKEGLHVYEYINDTLINMMQSSEWYDGFVINDPGLMTDYNNKFLGVARIRQHRMERNVCKPPKTMQFLNMTCWPEFSIFYADRKGIRGGSWVNTTLNKEKDRLQNMWFYTDSKDTGTISMYADLAHYPGGGYVAFLGRTLRNSYANFRIIARKMWIDMVSRSVFIEFLAYNANDNIFNSITLIFEQSASGYTHSIITVTSLRLIFVQNDEMERITLIVFLVFAFWVCILFFKYSVEIVKKFLTFYKDLWFLMDLFIISLSFACMAITLMRIGYVKSYLDELEKRKHNEFVPYGKLFYNEYIFTLFAGILITVATIRLWRFLRFALMFRVFERTVQLFIGELFTAFFCWFCLCLGFAMTAVLLFGNDFKQFSTTYSAIRVLFQWSLKTSLRFKQFTVENMFFPFFACYLVTVYYILFLYVSIIVLGFKKARLEFSEKSNPYNIKDFLKEQLHYLPTLWASHIARFKGGEDAKKLNITPKHNVFRFANCLSAPAKRMKSMIVISKCIVKNMTESEADKGILTETEVNLMKQACREVLFRDRGPKTMMLFYKGLHQGKKQIIDEERIALMARVTAILLEKPTVKAKWWKTTSEMSKCCQFIKVNLKTMRRCCLRLELMSRKFETVPSVL